MPVTQYGSCFQNIYFSLRQNHLFKIEILCNCQIHTNKKRGANRLNTPGVHFGAKIQTNSSKNSQSREPTSQHPIFPCARGDHGQQILSTTMKRSVLLNPPLLRITKGPHTPTTRTTSIESRPATHNHTGRPGQHLPRMKPQLRGSTGILGPEKVLEDREALLDPRLASLMERPTTAVNHVQDIKRECPLEQGKQIHSDQTGTLTPLCGQGRHACTIGKETWSNTVVHLTH